MGNFVAKYGQSIYDVCLQTYGDFNLLTKLMRENNISDFEEEISQKNFKFDSSLIKDFDLQNFNALYNIVYTTNQKRDESGKFIVDHEGDLLGGLGFVLVYR